jgi:hypothetical protein
MMMRGRFVMAGRLVVIGTRACVAALSTDLFVKVATVASGRRLATGASGLGVLLRCSTSGLHCVPF